MHGWVIKQKLSLEKTQTTFSCPHNSTLKSFVPSIVPFFRKIEFSSKATTAEQKARNCERALMVSQLKTRLREISCLFMPQY